MQNSNAKNAHLPSTGQVLAFMVDCLGVPKDSDHFNYAEFKRLKNGGLAPDTYWEVARKTMAGIVASFVGDQAAKPTIDNILKQRASTPVRKYHLEKRGPLVVPVPELEAPEESLFWKFDEAGNVTNFGEIILHDWMEFLQKHEYLVQQSARGDSKDGKAFIFWLHLFVIPFLASSIHEYQFRNTDLESGMPGGSLWYLPHVTEENPETQDRKISRPVNKVLLWWEDLLGTDLTDIAGLLCDAGDDAENAKRQVRLWRDGDRPPDQVTIERWCKVSWAEKYRGTFLDDPGLTLAQRWDHCRAFLIQKGFYPDSSNWLDKCDHQSRAVFSKVYRGEMLEQEIPPFKVCRFSEFFESGEPIATGLPVADLIERVATRYAAPSNPVLKARLFIAAAFQRAFRKLCETRSEDFALTSCVHFNRVYNFIVGLHADGNSREKVLARLYGAPPEMAICRESCDWLYDEARWYELVGCMKKAAGCEI